MAIVRVANGLQIAVGAFSGNRQGGEWSEANLYDNVKKGIPTVEKNDYNVNFTPQQLQETVALCRRGEKLEPQNAYFTWMRFYFLMLSWQDTKARQALHEAASKSYWNNHQKEFRLLYVKAASDILGRPLNPYEIVTFNSILYEFSGARIREMGRIIGWEGVKLKRAEKHNAALELWADSYRTMTLAAHGQSRTIPFLVDYAMLSMAANGATYPSRESFRNGQPKKLSETQRMQGLFAYAKKYHRPDLATQLELDWQKNHALLQNVKASNQISQAYFMLSVMQAGTCLLTLSILIVISILGALLTWLFFECYRIFARRKNTFDEDASINLWDRWKGVIACSGFPSFLLGILFLAGLIFLLTIIIPQNIQYGITTGWNIPYYTSIPFNSTIFGHMFEIFSNLTELYPFPVWWRIFALLTPLIAGASFVLFQCSQTDTRKTSIRRKLGKWFYFALLFTAWGIPTLTTEYNLLQITLTTICIAFLLVSFVWMWWKSRKRTDLKLSLMQSSLSGWILVGSVLVLTLIIGQMTVDKRLQPWAGNQLRGEMHLLHQVVDAPSKRQ